MNTKVRITLRNLAKHFRVRIKYIGGLPDRVQGFADPNPHSRTIVVNAHKPAYEHIHTILHEMAHFLLHIDQPYSLTIPRWLSWSFYRLHKSAHLGEIAYKTKRALRRKCGPEWQADLWALTAYPLVGTRDDLQAFLDQHPEMLKWFLLVIAVQLKRRIGQFIRKLIPLQTA